VYNQLFVKNVQKKNKKLVEYTKK